MSQQIFYVILVLGVVVACTNSPQVTSPAPPPDSGIEGIVLIGPMRPGHPGQASSEIPYSAAIVVQDQDRQDLMTVQSEQDGTFRIPLPPGRYWLKPIAPNPGVPPSASPVRVTVKPHRFTRVDIHYDTGLR